MAGDPTSSSAQSDPRFQYTDIQPPRIDQARVDRMADTVFSPDAAKLGWGEFVRIGLLTAFATLYVIIWEKNAAAKLLVAKQQYEQDQANKNKSTVANDPLGDRKKP